jgi:hypothetical protein
MVSVGEMEVKMHGCRISFEIWNYGSKNEESEIRGEIWTKVMRNEISGKIERER